MPRRTHRADRARELRQLDHLAAQAAYLDRFARAGRLHGPRHAGAGLLPVAREADREAIATGRPDARFRPGAPLESGA